ncbi:SymE family type I addiction module toxin [Erwinia persicina]|uniref:SymE family type I addiction module toxin n=1 Tax=Erwinia persicina TaxID=55211 RepID=UPI00177F3632|nr:SymE family type I addiction module toxin [Erwinia persicina]MBD8216257.1 type I toxin-antitoxin system SymE family toxin [Erwinia persicina]
MAKYDCKSEPVISKIQRKLKVGYISIRHEDAKTGLTHHYSRSPSLNLKGLWLEACGFPTDTSVTVRVMPGCLVIAANPPPVTPARQLLARSEALPEAALKELHTVMEALLIREGLGKVTV